MLPKKLLYIITKELNWDWVNVGNDIRVLTRLKEAEWYVFGLILVKFLTEKLGYINRRKSEEFWESNITYFPIFLHFCFQQFNFLNNFLKVSQLLGHFC